MGGVGRGFKKRELQSLEKFAKDALRDGVQPRKRNVFISFVSEDLGEVNLLRGQAKNENSNLEFNDWSLKEAFDSDKAEYIKRGIRERIRQSSITICYISEDTAKSKWVDWEIRESIKLGKKVIAMHKGDKPPRNLPPAVKEFSIPIVPWTHERISREIDSLT